MAARAQAEPSRGELTAATWESGRDGATWMPVAESVEQGDVLIAEADGDDGGSLRLSAASADPAVVGIAAKASSGALAPVATSGVAWCKVDAGTAPIRPGDLLTASSTPGRAMKAQTVVPGTILGKALERLDVGVGLIRIVITLR